MSKPRKVANRSVKAEFVTNVTTSRSAFGAQLGSPVQRSKPAQEDDVNEAAENKSGRFSEGVLRVGARDRDGLIKLADR